MIFRALRDLGDFGADCYILSGDGKNALLIDAPCSPEKIIGEIEKAGLALKSVYLTHGHCDHIEALGGLYEKYGCEVYIHEKDLPMLTDERLSLAAYFGTPFEPFRGAKPLYGNENISDCGLDFKVLHTPGHSPGSVCYIFGDRIFSGDTIFENSVGRTDLGGNYDELMSSVETLIKSCDISAPVFPGHGCPTNLKDEYDYSPWLEEIRSKGVLG